MEQPWMPYKDWMIDSIWFVLAAKGYTGKGLADILQEFIDNFEDKDKLTELYNKYNITL